MEKVKKRRKGVVASLLGLLCKEMKKNMYKNHFHDLEDLFDEFVGPSNWRRFSAVDDPNFQTLFYVVRDSWVVEILDEDWGFFPFTKVSFYPVSETTLRFLQQGEKDYYKAFDASYSASETSQQHVVRNASFQECSQLAQKLFLSGHDDRR